MNILLVTGYHVDENWWRSPLFSHLSNQGYQVYILDQPAHFLKNMRRRKNARNVVPTIWLPSRFASDAHIRRAQVASFRELRKVIDLVWIVHPDFNWVWSYFPNVMRVYDAFDYYAALQPARYADIVANEQQTIRAADIIFCASKLNYERLAKYSSSCVFVPNAVEPATMFALASQNRSQTLGVVSYSESRIDWGLLEEISQRNPSLNIEIIAHTSRSSTKNIRVLGPVPSHRLREVMCHWKVGLIAYPENEFNTYAGPLKIFEYVAAGCNVVGISNREVKEYATRYPFVYYAETKAELLKQINTALNCPMTAADQMGFLDVENWSQRAYTVHQAVQDIRQTRLQVESGVCGN